MNQALLTESIKKHEGCSLESYQDSVGVWTAGWGRNLQEVCPGRSNYKGLTFTQATVDKWLDEDIAAARHAACGFPQYRFLDTDARQNAFIEMCFNLGETRLRKFTNMLKAISAWDWEAVSVEALDSKWHKDVLERAETLAEMLRTGEFPASLRQ